MSSDSNKYTFDELKKQVCFYFLLHKLVTESYLEKFISTIIQHIINVYNMY